MMPKIRVYVPAPKTDRPLKILTRQTPENPKSRAAGPKLTWYFEGGGGNFDKRTMDYRVIQSAESVITKNFHLGDLELKKCVFKKPC